MIFIDRSTVPKPTLYESDGYRGQRDKVYEQASRAEFVKKQARVRFDFDWLQKSGIMASLFELFHKKCAYCEQPVTAEAGVIDQFRPAALYPWLAYEWENLYLSCPECSRNKGGNFPLGEGSVRAENPEDPLDREKPLLIDPCAEQPQSYLAFNEKGQVLTAPGAIAPNRAEATILVLGLDRIDLERQRKQKARQFRKFIDQFELKKKVSPLDSKKWQARLKDESIFAAVKRGMFAEWLAGESKLENDVEKKRKILDEMNSRYNIASYIASLRPDIKEAAGPPDRKVGRKEPSKWAAQKKTTKKKIRKSTDRTDGDIKKSRKVSTEEETDALPLSNATISFISITNFKAIAHIELRPVERPEEDVLESREDESSLTTLTGWMTFLGENGSGKSSILQAIALALAGERILDDKLLKPASFLMRGKRKGRVRLELTGGDPIEMEITKTRFHFKSGGSGHGAFVRAYGSTRLLPLEIPETPPKAKTERVEYRNMFNPFIPLIDADSWLMNLEESPENDDFRPARLVIKDLLGLEEEALVEKDEKEILVDGMPLECLSAGYQTIVALACDIMAGIPMNLNDMQLAQGIVLIDEIGSHLHPGWKMRIVSRLRKAFPLIQFIVSTHEPLCLRGHSKGEVLVVKREADPSFQLDPNKPAKKIVYIEHDLPSPRSLRIDQLLTSSHFGLNSTIDPQIDEKFNMYYQLLARKDDLEREDLEKCKQLGAELQNYGVLGYTRRDQLVYEAIDEFLAKEQDEQAPWIEKTEDDDSRKRRRKKVLKTVQDLWRYAKIIDEEETP